MCSSLRTHCAVLLSYVYRLQWSWDLKMCPLERCPHFRGCYVQASVELGPEDVSLLKCPHFSGWHVQALGLEDVPLSFCFNWEHPLSTVNELACSFAVLLHAYLSVLQKFLTRKQTLWMARETKSYVICMQPQS